MRETFSKRYGFSSVVEAEITIREDAPQEMRAYLLQTLRECGFQAKDLRAIICQVLKVLPDRNNWSEQPVLDECIERLDDCAWYKVYDMIERFAEFLGHRNREAYEHLADEMNGYFIEHGIGWKLADGLVEYRGTESFEEILKSARQTEYQAGHTTASKELHQAISDLSRRPAPDPTGAIQHAMASLECVARQITGDPKSTLGTILNDHQGLIPKPLDQGVKMAWGFASEYGRHIREGREPDLEDAELVVGLCASVSNYLIKKSTK